MSFKDDMSIFFSSKPRLAPDKNPEFFFGSPYEINKELNHDLITILSGGIIHATFPHSFQLHPLNCYVLLYTESGYGKLYLDNNVFSLSANTLLFFKCHEPIKIDIAVSPWEYKVFFIEGKTLDFYYNILPGKSFPLFTLPEYSPIIRSIHKLAQNKTGPHIHYKLTDARLLTDIFTDLLLDSIESEDDNSKTPPYLQEMKSIFDIDYQESYTLDELEEHFSISKYRLCREFHAYFGESPLQYLNMKRIDMARDLLLTTDCRIHEIGSLVGIENTNHFIYLFKKKTGLTPLSYRKKHLNKS